MRRLTRTAVGAALAMGMVSATAAPGAAAVPGPRPEQWWFGTWDVQDKVWPVTQGKGVTVAVLDTGVQANLPELADVVLPGQDATGARGDGRTDVDDASVPGHGTGMASLIASQGGPSRFVGVAPQVKILPVVVHANAYADAAGIRFAVDHGAKVINISQASSAQCLPEVQQAISYAIQHEVVVVAGAGNTGNAENSSQTPANCAGVLAVGAVDFQFRPWEGTQRQPYVAVAAPGVHVGGVLRDGQFHQSPGGTSGASALTAAAVALVRSKYPDMPAREVVQRIIASARDVGPSGKDEATGYGLIRPSHALVDKVSKSAPNPVFDAYDKWAAANGKGGSAAKPSESSQASGGPDWTRVAIFGGGVVIAILLVVFAIARAGRARRRGAGGYAGSPRAPVPPGPSYQQGPPPSFGPPQGPPPGGSVPPPGTEGRRPAPSFEPPDHGSR
jgi:type VII secretion-associated serine protease mycosin